MGYGGEHSKTFQRNFEGCIVLGDIQVKSAKVFLGNFVGNDMYDHCHLTNCYRAEYQFIDAPESHTSVGISATAVLAKDLNLASFYTDTVGWNEVWDLSDLDVENGKYPKLEFQNP